jgi:predicted transcriptional regulator
MRLPSEIRERRREKRVSQGELGLELGRSQFWVSLIESGQIALEPTVCERMVLAINRIAERKKAIAEAQQEAAERVARDFENLKKSADSGQ